MSIILCSLLLSVVAIADCVCVEGENYVKFTKVTSFENCYEFWSLNSGNQVLYSSPVFKNPGTQIIESCLPATTNNMYTLVFGGLYAHQPKLSCSDWNAESLLTIEGKHGNVFFKGSAVPFTNLASIPISLYYDIETNSAWKLMSGIVDGLWNQFNFDDSLWLSVTLGTLSSSMTGTQYYRKVFTGVPDMAAYELRMNYQFGIVAYINGMEIYRDNMPTGIITPYMACSGSYSSLEFRSIIRPGSEVSSTQSVLSVELHFTDMTTPNDISFDAFLALLRSSTLQDNCFTYPYSVTLNTAETDLFDFLFKTDTWFPSDEVPVSIDYTLNGPKAMINAYGIWAGLDVYDLPVSLVIQGKQNTGNDWITLGSDMRISSYVYSFSIVKAYSNLDLYSSYRGIADSYGYMSVFELQPMTCSHSYLASIEFEQEHYSFYLYSTPVYIRPIVTIGNCTIIPLPSSGLSFNSETCTLSGKMNTTLSLTHFTVTSSNLSGSFSLEVIECMENLVSLGRVYGLFPSLESFSLKNDDTGDVIMESVVEYRSEISYEFFFCLPDGHYSIATFNSDLDSEWAIDSFVYVHYVLDYSLYDTVVRGRKYLVMDEFNVFPFSLYQVIRPREEWWYLMGSIPTNWYGPRLTGWTLSSAPNYPDSTNTFQLYKKFIVIPSLENVSLLVFSIRYHCDLVIYINTQLVFKRGDNILSVDSICSQYLYEKVYHQVTVPVHTIGTADHPSVQYVKEGNNTIAIGFVTSATDFRSHFDCSLRLAESSSRSYNITHGYIGFISGDIDSITNDYSYTSVYHSSCSSVSLWLFFNDVYNERYEWINSISVSLASEQDDKLVRQFDILGYNQITDELEMIKEVSNITWRGYKTFHIWVPTFRQYRVIALGNFTTGNPSSCDWKIGNIQLWNRYIDINPPPLTYPNPLVFTKNIPFEDVYPNSDMYYDFSISPVLPRGIHLDPYSGTLYGIPKEYLPPLTFTVIARNVNGTLVSSQFTLSVGGCSQGESVISIVVYISAKVNVPFTIYQGRGVRGNVIASVSSFPLLDKGNEFGYCLPHGIYTLVFNGTMPLLTIPDHSYYLAVDDGEFHFHSAVLNQNWETDEIWSTYVFSSYLPFQMGVDEWKVFKENTLVRETWLGVDYDDSDWSSLKASRIGTSDAVTLYVRKSFDIPDINDYHVLNVRVKYSGGLAAYVNGIRVALFRLDFNYYDSFTEAFYTNDNTEISLFHAILPYVNGRTGKNVIGFEIHRPKEQSTEVPFVFDATGVFGVNDCSVVLDSVDHSIGVVHSDDLFDMNPYTETSFPNSEGESLIWSLDNYEGTQFNHFGILSLTAISTWSFTFAGYTISSSLLNDPAICISNVTNSMFLHKREYIFPALNGSKKWATLTYESHHKGDTISLKAGEVLLYYCVPSPEKACAPEGVFPYVGNGELSTASCPNGYSGEQYRLCTNGVFGEIDDSECTLIQPELLRYDSRDTLLVIGIPVSILPHYIGLIDVFYLNEEVTLPEGLTLNEHTGAITGMAQTRLTQGSYTITGKNDKGSISTVVTFSIRSPECKGEGYPSAEVGKAVFTKCSSLGNFYGLTSRSCVLGERDGVWTEPHGECFPADGYRPSHLVYDNSVITVPVGSVVNVTCSVQGGTSVFQMVSGDLPPGLQLSIDNGTISGVASFPFSSGSVTIEARNIAGSVNTTLTFAVIEPAANLKYSDSAYSITYQESFTAVPSFVGNEVSFSVSFGSLPEGLQLDEKTGVISGIPTELITNLMCEITCENVFGETKAVLIINVKKNSSWIPVSFGVICVIVLLVAVIIPLKKRKKRQLPITNPMSL